MGDEMREAIRKFGETLALRDMSPKTQAGYVSDLHRFVRFYELSYGRTPSPAEVMPLDVVDYKRALVREKKTPSTVNRALAAVRAFFEWAKERGIVDSNPARQVKGLESVALAPKALSMHELHALLREVRRRKKPRDIALVTLMAHTGLRVSEVSNLDTDDIKVEGRSAWVVVRSGKGSKYRECPLNSDVRQALSEYLEKRGTAPGPLFLSQKGGRLSSRAIESLVQGYSRRAGIGPISPHVLRHTFCKALVDRGESLDRVAKIAGHEDLNTTKRYTTPTREDLIGAVRRLESMER